MQLHDILPPIQMLDNTFFYIAGLLLLALFMLLFKYFYKTQKKDARYYLNVLKHCDFQDAKKTALQFSYYGKRIFTDEAEKSQFLELQKQLKQYKYIQNTTALPEQLEENIKQLLQQAKKHHV